MESKSNLHRTSVHPSGLSTGSFLSNVYLRIISFIVNCVWGPWSDFSSCDKSCGGGKMYKTRMKLVTEKYGGSCSGWDKVEKDCNTHKCASKFPF